MKKTAQYLLLIAFLYNLFVPTHAHCFLYRPLSTTESCLFITIGGLIYLEPIVPDLRFQPFSSTDKTTKVILSWPVHFVEFEPVNHLCTTLFVEPQYVPIDKEFSILAGSRLTYEMSSENLLIWEAGGLKNAKNYGMMTGIGYGWTSNGHNTGIIMRISKAGNEIRGDISFDYWPNKYFDL